MAEVLDVVRELVRLNEKAGAPAPTPEQVQRLLYRCQGWSLGLRDRPLYGESIEALPAGPVTPSVAGRLAGVAGITSADLGPPLRPLTDTEAALIEVVWADSIRPDGSRLEGIGASDPSWGEARLGTGAGGSEGTLSAETMTAHFRAAARRMAAEATPAGFPVLDPVECWQADDAEEERLRAGGERHYAGDIFPVLIAEAEARR